mmetsp:Transcript_17184/g.15183  ORF Transcript_17184/g.15183 Transcript_17184/m.15183 type:complete len:100 (+) Transcript_17184:13-312(+)
MSKSSFNTHTKNSKSVQFRVPKSLTTKISLKDCIGKYAGKEVIVQNPKTTKISKKKFMRNANIILSTRKEAELTIKKKKAKRNKQDLSPSHIKILHDLK